ncbi:hypothetical protein NBEOAGPD_2597 [Methylobacterium gregans]|uniref:Uncharacterized protein n=1 Tax=Methylobacterium gregans TaxID=374424 RepID=A0AA37HPX2_9HYPH|nr:hypothetical protein [Methylobacterium gregans]GJD79371.1 hypothetical protein NBEOAGPD_2597 [Methylobacterium gregans]
MAVANICLSKLTICFNLYGSLGRPRRTLKLEPVLQVILVRWSLLFSVYRNNA